MPVKITYIEDQKYGLPEQKKYPMPDKQHVISAIKFFNYVEPKYEKQLAKAILARIEEYGMSFDDIGVGEDNRFSKYIPDQHLAHHGIKGQKWGVRRYQNEDGTLTNAGKRRYNQIVNDARQYGDKHAKLEYMTRVFKNDINNGKRVLVTKDTKEYYTKLTEDLIKDRKIMTKKYSEFSTDIRSLDDGYDYVCTKINSPELGRTVEYMSLVGKTSDWKK